MIYLTQTFPHWRNQDGSWESICPRCFNTLATAHKEAELLKDEENHNCVVFNIARLRTVNPKPTLKVWSSFGWVSKLRAMGITSFQCAPLSQAPFETPDCKFRVSNRRGM